MKAKKIFLIAIILFSLITLGMGPRKDVITTPEKRVVWPPPPFEPKIEFVKSITRPEDIGVKKGFFRKLYELFVGKASEGQIIRPFGIAADDKGRLYIADTGAMSLHIFDLTKGKYKIIDGSKYGPFASPVSVDTDADENIFLSDSVQRRVYVFSRKGKYLREIGTDDVFQRPTGIAINKTTGLLYVVDTLACKIHVYTTQGQYKFSFGERGISDGQFNYPTFIVISKDGELYVTDTLNFRIQIFDKNGRVVSKFGKLGNGTGDLSNPRGIALDSDGNVYVVDTRAEVLQIFDKQGQLLLVFGRSGRRVGEFAIPSGIAIDNHDNIYISDSYNSRVQVFRYLKNNLLERQ